ncbi:glycosyltransferase family 2 protein [Paenibacillus larvae]|uniref:glycosyltransferase family 2 protein n=1 Tax=Paenibacillus larvae TaxID=1464 RepID=UPI002853F0C7|nr:glycosyltransferase family 2 protein [Paenibacillus larvae]MDR5584018.1 glycosyltransferase family 2 protein [Paenibacillus larvae]MDR5599102.1 glycosyltransferase family 2 protein [Paenibacillus larvae]
MKYVYGFFYRNSLDLLRLALNSIKPCWNHTVIIDNTSDLALRGESFPQGVQILEPPVPLTFTQSMNYLIRVGEECEADAVIFMHNDVELHPGTIEAYLSALENLVHSDKNWGVLLANGFLLAAMRMEAVKKIGLWDTVWPDIFSDYDYCQRIHIAGYDIVDTYLPLTHHNGGSNTIKKDPLLFSLTQVMGPLWLEIYKAKWGDMQVQEKYRIPYDPSSTTPPPTHWPDYYRDYKTYINEK